jgi:pyruvate dehydrogenase E1 component beta subunit
MHRRAARARGGGPIVTRMNLVQAINSGLRCAMQDDESVLLLGEDVGQLGGVFRVTQGLREEFGADRVLDTPLSEAGILGASIGMALHGLRPVSEIQFADFIYPGFDQLVSEAAKYRYRTAGEFHVPMVVRAPYGGGIRGGQYHSQSPEALFIHTPGLKVVCPSNPYDAKGLLIAAIRDEDPVIFFEPKRVYRAVKMDVPDTTYALPLGVAKVVRPGGQVTCVAWGAMLYEAFTAAEEAAKQGADVEVIDLRTLWPLDVDAIVSSVEKTGRIVIVHEAPRTCGFGAELMALVTERAFLHLEAPPIRVTGWDTPFPLTHEREYLPLAHRIAPALLQTARY